MSAFASNWVAPQWHEPRYVVFITQQYPDRSLSETGHLRLWPRFSVTGRVPNPVGRLQNGHTTGYRRWRSFAAPEVFKAFGRFADIANNPA